MPTRRSFLTYFSLGCFASCFPIALAACTPDRSTSQTTEADDKGGKKPLAMKKTADGFTIMGTVAELDKTGNLLTKQVAVLRDPTNPKQVVAINPKCTHKGCIVAWKAEEKKYECPCHESDFAANGQVLKGPATEPLATYPAKIVGSQVLVKL
jgi:cytochrome b6-f complex iron-sulfur subunit